MFILVDATKSAGEGGFHGERAASDSPGLRVECCPAVVKGASVLEALPGIRPRAFDRCSTQVRLVGGQ